MTIYCETCPRELDTAAILCADTRCTDCLRADIRRERRGTRPVVVDSGGEWDLFLAAVRKVAAEHGGQVDWTHVRPLLRGRVEPKHVGQLVRRARSRGLLVEIAHHRSEDVVGKNAGRLEPLYEYRSAA